MSASDPVWDALDHFERLAHTRLLALQRIEQYFEPICMNSDIDEEPVSLRECSCDRYAHDDSEYDRIHYQNVIRNIIEGKDPHAARP